MKKFYSIEDVEDLDDLVNTSIRMKNNPYGFSDTGKDKTLVLLFFNPSLRTKLSTQRAAMNLGMHVIPMDMKSSWNWEFEDGAMMNLDTVEHVKEAAQVISRYADIIAIRSFPTLGDQQKDYQDRVVQQFIEHCPVPVVNLESAIRHPLQSFADLMTIREKVQKPDPKIVLSWAPHPKALPQAVSNSFLEWMHAAGHSVIVTHPQGYELNEGFMKGHTIEYDQDIAFQDADIIYVKNWSSFGQYGQVLTQNPVWMITKDKLEKTSNAKLMHCLPVRRNVVIADDAMDSEHSAILDLAENRMHTAQAVLFKILSAIE